MSYNTRFQTGDIVELDPSFADNDELWRKYNKIDFGKKYMIKKTDTDGFLYIRNDGGDISVCFPERFVDYFNPQSEEIEFY